MAEAVLNCSIDRCLQGPPIVCADSDVIEKGQVEIIGAGTATTYNMVAIAAAAADGLTQRAADTAADKMVRPDRWAPIYQAEDVTMDKLPGVDSIAAGTKLWFSADDNALVDSLSDVDAAGVVDVARNVEPRPVGNIQRRGVVQVWHGRVSHVQDRRG